MKFKLGCSGILLLYLYLKLAKREKERWHFARKDKYFAVKYDRLLSTVTQRYTLLQLKFTLNFLPTILLHEFLYAVSIKILPKTKIYSYFSMFKECLVTFLN